MTRNIYSFRALIINYLLHPSINLIIWYFKFILILSINVNSLLFIKFFLKELYFDFLIQLINLIICYFKFILLLSITVNSLSFIKCFLKESYVDFVIQLIHNVIAYFF